MAMRQIFKTQITDVNVTAVDTLGSLRIDGDKLYKYMKLQNTSGVACVAGDPVSYKATPAAGYSVNVVTSKVSEADAQPICAGCVQATISSAQTTAGVFIWVQVTGLISVPAAVTSGVVGSGAMMSGTDKTFTVVTGVIESCCTVLSTGAAGFVSLQCTY